MANNSHEPTETPYDAQGNVIDERPQASLMGGLTIGAPPVPPTPMPASIAKALVVATRNVAEAARNGQGREVTGAGVREYQFSTIDDVLAAAHDALATAGLVVYPQEVACHVELRNLGLGVGYQQWATYSFRFLLVHESGDTWMSPNDIRHATLQLEGGNTEGKAQSHALKHFLRGLLRIRTGEPDLESTTQKTEQAERAQAPQQPRRGPGRPRKQSSQSDVDFTPALPTYPFDFGEGGGMSVYTADQINDLFSSKVAGLKKSLRNQWEEANREGLAMLCNNERNLWLAIREELDQK